MDRKCNIILLLTAAALLSSCVKQPTPPAEVSQAIENAKEGVDAGSEHAQDGTALENAAQGGAGNIKMEAYPDSQKTAQHLHPFVEKTVSGLRGEDQNVLYEASSEVPALPDVEEKNYPALAAQLRDDFGWDASCGMYEYIEAYGSRQPELSTQPVYVQTVEILRADSKVFSVRTRTECMQSDPGVSGEAGETKISFTSYNYDSQKGEPVAVDHVFVNKLALNKKIAEVLCEQYPELDSKEALKLLSAYSLMGEKEKKQLVWNYCYDGILFTFYEPSLSQTEKVEVCLLFDDCGGLLNPYYGEGTESSSVCLKEGQDWAFDSQTGRNLLTVKDGKGALAVRLEADSVSDIYRMTDGGDAYLLVFYEMQEEPLLTAFRVTSGTLSPLAQLKASLGPKDEAGGSANAAGTYTRDGKRYIPLDPEQFTLVTDGIGKEYSIQQLTGQEENSNRNKGEKQ